MALKELASEYRQSGQLCRDRAHEIDRIMREKMEAKTIGATGIMREKKRATTLKIMARECFATAAYLENYYDRRMSFDRYI